MGSSRLWSFFCCSTGLALVLGCAPDAGSGGGGQDGGRPHGKGATSSRNGATGGSGTTTPAEAKAIVEIYLLDLWAQPLPEGERTLDVTVDGETVPLDTTAPARLFLGGAANVGMTLAAPDFETLTATIRYDGTSAESSAAVDGIAEGHGIALSHGTETVEGRAVPVHRVYLGLRHRWFSAEGRPPRRGNDVHIFMDGETAWKAVYDELVVADTEVLAAWWWWESDFELFRDPATHASLDPAARWNNTILGVLEQNTAVVRILVGQLWGQDGILSGVTVDDDLLYWAERPDDGIEFMGQANPTSGTFHFAIPPFSFVDRVAAADPALAGASFDPTPPIASTVPEHDVDLTQWPVEVDVEAASYHQKLAVVDHDVAFVGGMNLQATDWDTSNHYVFEPRRMGFDATEAERRAVALHEALPENVPRKDYMVRIEGPSAQDVADVFHRRWESQRALGVDYAEYASGFEVTRDIAPREAGKQVQVTATLPEPFWEHAIVETWLNAIRNAERYIYIEDQFFRAPILSDAIYDRMVKVPDLRLVVITRPVSEWTDPGCAQTHIANAIFETAFPDRYLPLQLRSFDTRKSLGIDETDAVFVDMYIHSKVLMVDDTFLSIGSCNKNNRGMVYEGELNVAMVDRPEATSLRHRIFANLMPGWAPTDDVAVWWDDLRGHAATNAAVHAAWEAEGFDLNLDGGPLPAGFKPSGFVYPLDFGSLSDCVFESIGPDMTGSAG